mmetsp:Transcript_5655/g.10151  ORF Transcript_5655/g.10151 Transcript_5655/m.10151 type:complete len:276 (-) Transcript_5655:1120-1947(-)
MEHVLGSEFGIVLCQNGAVDAGAGRFQEFTQTSRPPDPPRGKVLFHGGHPCEHVAVSSHEENSAISLLVRPCPGNKVVLGANRFNRLLVASVQIFVTITAVYHNAKVCVDQHVLLGDTGPINHDVPSRRVYQQQPAVFTLVQLTSNVGATGFRRTCYCGNVSDLGYVGAIHVPQDRPDEPRLATGYLTVKHDAKVFARGYGLAGIEQITAHLFVLHRVLELLEDLHLLVKEKLGTVHRVLCDSCEFKKCNHCSNDRKRRRGQDDRVQTPELVVAT